MIGIDWGTSSFRAYQLGADGAVLERRESGLGILEVSEGGFPAALRAAVGDWLPGADRVVLCGMVGSRQGWREAPYLACPAGPAELGAALMPLEFDGPPCVLVPGLRTVDAAGVPDVMRGEETKLVGLLRVLGEGAAVACLPGTHPKWARVAGGRIAGFATQMTGEVRAALLGHTILGRTAAEGADDAAAFDRGVDRSADPGGLLHHVFGTRTLHLLGDLRAEQGAGYLAGVLIGHEIRAALTGVSVTVVELAGAARLVALYGRAFDRLGVTYRRHDADLVAAGLWRLGGMGA